MLMRFATGTCVLGILLALAAAVLHMVNVGHFDWVSLGKAAGIASIMLVLWTSLRAKDRRDKQARAAQAPPRA
jgi:hypothetical protein